MPSTALLDPSRIEALRATGLLDHATVPSLDRLTRLASRLLAAPVALVSLVETDRQFFAAEIGLNEPWASMRETPLTHSFCQHVVSSGEPLIVEDAPGHPLVCDNLAIPDLGVVAYLGVPLRTREGKVLGSFCVADGETRSWTAMDLATLTDLAQSVMSELELREVTTVLHRTSQSYRGLLDLTTELVCAADVEGRITHVNRAWCAAFGLTLAEAREKRVQDLVVPEDLGRFQSVVARLYQGSPIQEFEVTALRADGKRVICRGNATPTYVADATRPDGRRIAGSHSVYRDVTAERLANAKRARLVSALECTPDFVGIANIDGQIEFLNRAGRALIGLADDVDLATVKADAFHPASTLELLATEGFPHALAHGTWSGHGEVQSVTGEIIPVSMVIATHPAIGDEETPFFSAIMHDVRAREAATVTLRESEARLANERAFLTATLESLSDGVVACDASGDLVLFNRATREFHGLPEELLPPEEWGRHYNLFATDGITPLRLDEIPLRRAFLGERVQDAQFVIAPTAGSPRTLLCNGQQIRAVDGSLLGAVVAMRDVTARVEAERALLDSESRFRSALEGGRFAYAALRLIAEPGEAEGNFLYTDVNEACEEMWGLPSDELVGSRFTDVWPTAVERGLLEACLSVHATGMPQLLECEAPEPSFEAQWLALHVVPTSDGVALLARDISAPKRAERELRLLVDVTHELANAKDLASAVSAALGSMATAIGWEYAESFIRPATSGWNTRATDDDVLEIGPMWFDADDARLARFASATASRPPVRQGDGLIGHTWKSARPVFCPALDAPDINFVRLRSAAIAGLRAGMTIPVLANGEVVAVLAFFTRNWKRVQQADVKLLAAVGAQVGAMMQRKMAEETLAYERRFLSTVLDTLSENVSVCAPDGRLVLFNRATTEMHGGLDESLEAGAWSERYGVFLPDGVTPFPPEQMPHVRVLSSKTDVLGIEYVVRGPSKGTRTLVANAHVLRNADGELMGSVCAARDMTAERDLERANRESEQRLSLVYNNVSDLLYLFRVTRDAQGEIADFVCESVNARTYSSTGQTADHYVGKSLLALIEPQDREAMVSRYLQAARSGTVGRFQLDTQVPLGRLVVDVTITPVADSDGHTTYVLTSLRDVTAESIAQAGLRESELGFRTMLETVRAFAVIVDVEGRISFVNDAILNATGWSRAAVVGEDWFKKFVPNAMPARRLFDAMISGADYIPHAESEIMTRTGSRRLVVWDNTVLRNAAGAVVGTASIGQDVTSQRSMEARLASLAENDELTGLLNRRGFMQQVDYGIRAARRHRRTDVLMYIDLDRFKPINDTYGHAEGDKALRVVSELLSSTIRESDFAGRLGGDEFAVYAVGSPENADPTAVAKRLHEALAAHNAQATREGRPYEIGFSIGLTEVLPDDSREGLLARADAALYRIKHAR